MKMESKKQAPHPLAVGTKIRIVAKNIPTAYGRVSYIHPDGRWLTLETEYYRESFWTNEIRLIEGGK